MKAFWSRVVECQSDLEKMKQPKAILDRTHILDSTHKRRVLDWSRSGGGISSIENFGLAAAAIEKAILSSCCLYALQSPIGKLLANCW